MLTGAKKIPKYIDSERLKIPKTDYLVTEESVSMDFQVCQPQKYRVYYLDLKGHSFYTQP